MYTEKRKEQCKRWRVKNPGYFKKWYADNPEKLKQVQRKARCKRFGITVEQFDTMMTKQGNRCGICRTHQSELKKTLNIDHGHKTGKFRGLLCHNCNVALGLLKDLPYVSLMNLCHYVRFAGFKTNDEQWEEMFGDKKGEQ